MTELDTFSGYFNPNPFEYKRIVVESDSIISKLSFFGRFHIETDKDEFPTKTVSLIAPEREVRELSKSDSVSINIPNDFQVDSVETLNPNNYPTNISYRIRGYIPVVTIFADRLTALDPRVSKHNFSLHLSPTHPNENPVEKYKNGETASLLGNTIPHDMMQSCISHGLVPYDSDEFNGISVPSPRELYSVGDEFIDEYNVAVSYGGSLWSPTKDNPQGSVEVTSIYVWFNSEDDTESMFDSAQHHFKTDDGLLNKAHDYTVVEEGDDFTFVKAWWD